EKIVKPVKPGVARAKWLVAESPQSVAVEQHPVFAQLEVDCPAHAVPQLIDKRFELPIQSADGEVRFALTFTACPEATLRPARPVTRPAGTHTKATKDKT